MKALIYISSILLAVSPACTRMQLDIPASACTVTDAINNSHSKAAAVQQVLNDIAAGGIPGVSAAIYTSEGYWAGAAGYSKIENRQAMQICNLQYGQSVAKTYLAVAILLMQEEGRINLDAKITEYLPEDVISRISNAGKITVRMLMNHTSGVPEYNDKAGYVSYLIQHPLHVFSTMDYLDYIKGKPLQFEPGSSYRYTNTNYVLLALIGDHVSGDHAAYIRDSILKPQGLTNSFYHDAGYLEKPELVNSYWDRYSNGQIENCSDMQRVNVGSLVGDDGIIATPVDYIRFLKALFDKQILSQASMDQMMSFVYKNPGDEAGYGLGLHIEHYKGLVNYGHTGGGIGSGCILVYFPGKDAYLFLGINMGTSIDSPNFNSLEDKINRIQDILIE